MIFPVKIADGTTENVTADTWGLDAGVLLFYAIPPAGEVGKKDLVKAFSPQEWRAFPV